MNRRSIVRQLLARLPRADARATWSDIWGASCRTGLSTDYNELKWSACWGGPGVAADSRDRQPLTQFHRPGEIVLMGVPEKCHRWWRGRFATLTQRHFPDGCQLGDSGNGASAGATRP